VLRLFLYRCTLNVLSFLFLHSPSVNLLPLFSSSGFFCVCFNSSFGCLQLTCRLRHWFNVKLKAPHTLSRPVPPLLSFSLVSPTSLTVFANTKQTNRKSPRRLVHSRHFCRLPSFSLDSVRLALLSVIVARSLEHVQTRACSPFTIASLRPTPPPLRSSSNSQSSSQKEDADLGCDSCTKSTCEELFELPIAINVITKFESVCHLLGVIYLIEKSAALSTKHAQFAWSSCNRTFARSTFTHKTLITSHFPRIQSSSSTSGPSSLSLSLFFSVSLVRPTTLISINLLRLECVLF
jgi:hypothetical protein